MSRLQILWVVFYIAGFILIALDIAARVLISACEHFTRHSGASRNLRSQGVTIHQPNHLKRNATDDDTDQPQ